METRTNSEKKESVLLVDDEEALVSVMTTSLQDSGFICASATSAASALNVLETTPSINVVVSDIRMPGADGLEMLQNMKARFADRAWLQSLLITGHPSLDNAVTAMRLDAVDFLSKPVHRSDLIAAVEKAHERASKYRLMLAALDRNKEKLDQLMQESDLVTSLLRRDVSTLKCVYSPSQPTAHLENRANPPKPDIPQQMSKKRILELLRFRELRPRFFKERLFSDPAWQMLLDLMENNLLEKEVSVSSLYIASGVPISTASRRLDDLEEARLVTRWDDPKDGRRQYVRVTAKAEQLITDYLMNLDKLLGDPKS